MPELSPHRLVDYLRISITDRCNERCLYCMPEGFKDWKERGDILTYEEILQVVRVSVKMGFRKFRLTGGEPTVRKGLVEFIQQMSAIPGVETISMTTNAVLLKDLALPLKQAGLRSINISLDALDPKVYKTITGGAILQVLEGIQAAKRAGLEQIKLNMVLIRGMNENQIWPVIEYAAQYQLPLRFIELMPISLSEVLNEKNFLPVGEVMKIISEREAMIPLGEVQMGHGPAKYYRLEKTKATLGFIGAITNLHFCDACNKIRLTADGFIRPCLGNHGEYDLKPALRNQRTDASIQETIELALSEKPPEHLFRSNYQPQRIMTAIGG